MFVVRCKICIVNKQGTGFKS